MSQYPVPSWLKADVMASLFAAVREHGGEMRLVGGVVRELVRGELSDAWPRDIDAATTLPPETMMMIAANLGIKAIPTGIAHGTITLVIAPTKLEVTTLRRDIATDGRHATVAYTDRFEEDASRRDFTMNALYLAQDGTVSDFYHGIEAAKAGEVNFIGDAGQRIREDGLRILRYFRFLATHGSGKVSEAAIAACRDNIAMLAHLSGERIQQEMAKLLAAKNPHPAIEQMEACGVLPAIVQGNTNLAAHGRLMALEAQYNALIHPWLRLSVLLSERTLEALEITLMRWRASNDIKQIMMSLAKAEPLRADSAEADHKKVIREHGAAYFRLLLLRSAALATMPWDLRSPFDAASQWQPPQFPVKGVDVIAYGVPQGEKVGEQLRKLEEIWEKSDYSLEKPDLLKKIKDGGSGPSR
jgi:poly(A) polymerase